jgi:hypothetical protein
MRHIFRKKVSNVFGQNPVLDIARAQMIPAGREDRNRAILNYSEQQALQQLRDAEKKMEMDAAIQQEYLNLQAEKELEAAVVMQRAHDAVAAKRAALPEVVMPMPNAQPNQPDVAVLSALGASEGNASDGGQVDENDMTKSSSASRLKADTFRVNGINMIRL